jgi:Zn-dependent M28 family amino/carboxypeptidase
MPKRRSTTKLMTPKLLICALAVMLAGCNALGASRQQAAEAITADTYRGYLERLASDEFEGRGPGSSGEQKTVEYLEQQLLALGLQPVGDSFRQSVPLVEITATLGSAKLGFENGGQHADLAFGDDMTIGTRRVQQAVAISNSDLVFVGYGIVAPEYGWNDYEGLDLRGKTVLILINDPGFATGDPKLFNGRAMTYYGRWTYKFEEAARQGAEAAIIIHDTAPAAYGWSVVRNGWTGPQFYAETRDGNAGRCALEGWITLERARQVLGMSGLDLDTLQQTARTRGFKAVPLGTRVSGGVRNVIRRARSPNVAAILPGQSRPNEYVIYMAHWDHFGRALALSGDTVFNGAVDNATGVAGILAIARGYRELLPAPARSVVFVAVTAEESGLLGSEYYADHPLVPLEKTAAVINIDAMHPLGRARDIEVVGYGASQLEDYLAEAARAQRRVLKPDGTPEHGYFYRSDHFNLARKGVPSLYVKSGIDLIGRPPGTGQAMKDDYTANRYHKQSDDYDPSWDLSGTIEDLQLLFEVGARIADEPGWPEWYEGNEFRAVREASAAMRAPRR